MSSNLWLSLPTFFSHFLLTNVFVFCQEIRHLFFCWRWWWRRVSGGRLKEEELLLEEEHFLPTDIGFWWRMVHCRRMAASDLDQFHDVLMTDDNGSVAKELHALLMRSTRNKGDVTFKTQDNASSTPLLRKVARLCRLQTQSFKKVARHFCKASKQLSWLA